MPHSSVEAGERALPDPVERRGRRVVDRTLEPRRGHRASPACHAKPMDRVRDSDHNVTSRMPLTGTSGSVGGLSGRPPKSTRPHDGFSSRGRHGTEDGPRGNASKGHDRSPTQKGHEGRPPWQPRHHGIARKTSKLGRTLGAPRMRLGLTARTGG